jgi:virulence-associated protein VagC
MTTRAKLFQNGGSQAVRLPQSCRFPEGATEVVVRREGRRIILEPVDEWSDDFRALVGAWTDEIPRPTDAATPKRDPFE